MLAVQLTTCTARSTEVRHNHNISPLLKLSQLHFVPTEASKRSLRVAPVKCVADIQVRGDQAKSERGTAERGTAGASAKARQITTDYRKADTRSNSYLQI